VGEHRAAHIDEIPLDRGLVVEVHGRRIGIFRLGEEVFAYLNVCPHQGGPVGTGGLFPAVRAEVRDRRLREYHDCATTVIACPWHGWEFDVRTGACLSDGSRRLRAFPAIVRDGEVIVALPEPRRVNAESEEGA
jgi:nitrite reductase/ring-hydroxylating ferredoxin subunit